MPTQTQYGVQNFPAKTIVGCPNCGYPIPVFFRHCNPEAGYPNEVEFARHYTDGSLAPLSDYSISDYRYGSGCPKQSRNGAPVCNGTVPDAAVPKDSHAV